MRYNSRQLEKTINKREIRRIDWKVVKRLVKFLYYNSGIKKTVIAMKCNLGYDKCLLYLDWLEIVDFIHRAHDEGHETIRLSERGIDLYKRKLNEIKSELKS